MELPTSNAATKSFLLLVIVAASQLLSSVLVDAHGHLHSPRSRNYVAFEDGREVGSVDADINTPLKEYDPNAARLGGTASACGIINGRNYDYPTNTLGTAFTSSNIQASYTCGQVIDLNVFLSVDHGGYFEFKVCPEVTSSGDDDGTTPPAAPEQSCFDAHPLINVGNNVDPNYPEREYITTVGGGDMGNSKFKLPSNVSGDLVLLQWHYVTANSCVAPGYNEFNRVNTYLPECTSIPSDGQVGLEGQGDVPEQFWNCAEIMISPCTNDTVVIVIPVSPTNTPTSPQPTIAATWFVDWSRNGGMCVADCLDTSAPCAGRARNAWEAGYGTVEDCCRTMSWKSFKDCAYAAPVVTTSPPSSVMLPTIKPATRVPTTVKPSTSMPSVSPITDSPSASPVTTSPSVSPTSSPSASPVTESPSVSPVTSSPSASPTTSPSASPVTAKPTASPVTNKPTSRPSTFLIVAPTLKPTSRPTTTLTSKPTTKASIGDTRWYPDQSGAGKCKNDGQAPSWMHHKYGSQATCCSSHYSWAYNDCMGTNPASSNKWYIDWSTSKCRQDCEKSASSAPSCGGLVPGTWVLLHDTSDACCRVHVSYAVESCKSL